MEAFIELVKVFLDWIYHNYKALNIIFTRIFWQLFPHHHDKLIEGSKRLFIDFPSLKVPFNKAEGKCLRIERIFGWLWLFIEHLILETKLDKLKIILHIVFMIRMCQKEHKKQYSQIKKTTHQILFQVPIFHVRITL